MVAVPLSIFLNIHFDDYRLSSVRPHTTVASTLYIRYSHRLGTKCTFLNFEEQK